MVLAKLKAQHANPIKANPAFSKRIAKEEGKGK